MNLLIINTTAENDIETQTAINKLTEKADKYKVINTSEFNISHCIGCYVCMLQTPGICCLKDDYHIIFKSFLEYDNVIFVCDTAFGFVNHKMKNIADRSFPLATILTHFKDGEIRHIPRYNKSLNLYLLYKGDANQELLNDWLNRYAINMAGKSLGAFPISNFEEALKCIF